jgi:RNA polymerase sigma-70 factor (ECF subfamily)
VPKFVAEEENQVESARVGELVARIIAGEKAAESELIQQYSRGVSVILNRATGDPSVSEDLSQETFRITLEKIRAGEVREPERLSGFIVSLAKNLASEYFRKSRRTEGFADPDAVYLIPESAPNQLDRLLQAEKAKIVRRVLSELSGRDRQILERFYIAEDDKDQICADLQLSSLHFNRVLYRARERYRELYERLKL